MNSPFLDRLADHILVFDGAMGTSLQDQNPTISDFGGDKFEGWIDGLVLHSPHMIEKVHRSFLEVGCDVIETCTFQASKLRLAEWSSAERTIELNTKAAAMAKRLCAEYATPDKPRFVAGSIGPSGFLPSSSDPALGKISFSELVDSFAEQAVGLIEGGSDLLIIETAQDILEVKASIFAARKAFVLTGKTIPIHVEPTLDISGKMLLGTDIGAALTILESLNIDVIGLNCSTGPEYMREPITYLAQNTSLPISCIPNAGLPQNVDGQAVFPLEPKPMADQLEYFVTNLGINIVGGCCGTTPGHLQELIQRIQNSAPKQRQTQASLQIASAMRSIDFRQQPPPLLIGERVNSQGSRTIKRLLLEDNYEDIVEIGRKQVEGGAHALDVCVALTERADEAEQMHDVVKSLQMAVDAPIVIDSTSADVIKAALEINPGRGLVNSINLENGLQRCQEVLPLVQAHGALVIALTIDEEGMAKTRERKLAIAQRIRDIAVNDYGLKPEQIIFDALTFTLATGEEEWINSGLETIEGIKQIKQSIPNVSCVLGVSNVSFGLSPASRGPLNSIFLYHCVAAGLDAAIINPAHLVAYAEIDPKVRELAEALIFNRSPNALADYIEYFEENQISNTSSQNQTDPFEGLTPAKRIHTQILLRRKDDIEDQIDLVLKEQDPVAVLNEILLPAMKEVGDKFGAGELILPFVLQSAEVMKRAVAHVEKFLDKAEGHTKGIVVIATVYGDVHDIGKNLVNTILSNNGYTVHDLGKQVPINTIIDKAVEVKADAIGLSALLVSTSKQMPLCLKELSERDLNYPVIIGGAAINRGFGRRILYLDEEKLYSPGVFYCKDAFEGLETVDKLLSPDDRTELLDKITSEAEIHRDRESNKAKAKINANSNSDADADTSDRSSTRTDVAIPKPPFWGARTIKPIDINAVYPHIDRNSLYKMSWQFKGIRDKDQWQELITNELEPRLALCMQEAQTDPYLDLQAVYGYWPALAEGNDILVFDPQDHEKEIGRYSFPRQSAQNRLCLADYIKPHDQVSNNERDVIALQLVTVGPKASERSNAAQAEGQYDDMLRIHGFATQMAEATAEYIHQQIRNELSLTEDQGRRYSWGYPACPDLEDHEVFFNMVPTQEIGVELTTGFQLVPEQSTAAIVLHHPEARYFAVYTAQSAPAAM